MGKAFESLAARWLLGKRRRLLSMCLLVYSSKTKERLEEMRLALSGEQKTQLSRVASTSPRPRARASILGMSVMNLMLDMR